MKTMTLNVTQEEQDWIHMLARKRGSTIIRLIISLLEDESNRVGIPVPVGRSIRKKYRSSQDTQMGISGREKFFNKIDEELESHGNGIN